MLTFVKLEKLVFSNNSRNIKNIELKFEGGIFQMVL